MGQEEEGDDGDYVDDEQELPEEEDATEDAELDDTNDSRIL